MGELVAWRIREFNSLFREGDLGVLCGDWSGYFAAKLL